MKHQLFGNKINYGQSCEHFSRCEKCLSAEKRGNDSNSKLHVCRNDESEAFGRLVGELNVCGGFSEKIGKS
jgi:hypothetical protein